MPVRHPILLPTTIYEKNNDCYVRMIPNVRVVRARTHQLAAACGHCYLYTQLNMINSTWRRTSEPAQA